MEQSKLERLNNYIKSIEAKLASNNQREVVYDLTSIADLMNAEERQFIDRFIQNNNYKFNDTKKKKGEKSQKINDSLFFKELEELLQEVKSNQQFEVSRRINEVRENQMEVLNLEGLGLKNIPKEINQLLHLKELKLNKNLIKKIENLNELDNLEHLDLSFNFLEKIEGLNNLRKLKQLKLNNNNLQKIEELDNQEQLLELDLSENHNIESIEGLTELKNITKLVIRQCAISRIENLGELTSLTHLNLRKNKNINKIQGLEKLNQLQTLDIAECTIQKIENLENLSELIELELSNNVISEIEGIDALTKLTRINLNSNELDSLEGLQKLSNLEEVNLSFNKNISIIDHLESLEKIKILRLRRCNISRIENLETLSQLEWLDLSYNEIKKLENLDALTKLSALFLEGNEIDEESLGDKIHQTYFFNFLESKPDSFFFIIGDNPFIHEIDGLSESEYPSTYTYNPKLEEYHNNHHPIIKRHKPKILKKAKLVNIIIPHKLVLIGNSNSGKSSLVDFLLTGQIQQEIGIKGSTDTLEIRHWKPRNKPHFFVYDFGGQDFYHATYQMFFSRKATYLLIWSSDNNRNFQNNERTVQRPQDYFCFDINYWLGNIEYLDNPIFRKKRKSKSWCQHLVLIENKIDLYKDKSLSKLNGLNIDRSFGDYEQHRVSLLDENDKLIQSRRAWLKTYIQQLHPKTVKVSPRRKKAIEEYFDKWEVLRKKRNEWTFESLKNYLQTNYEHWKELKEHDFKELFRRFTAGGLMLEFDSEIPTEHKIWIDPSSLQKELFEFLNKITKHNSDSIDEGAIDVKKLNEKDKRIFSKYQEILLDHQIIFKDEIFEDGKKFIVPQKLLPNLKHNRLYQLAIQELSKAFTLKFKHFMPLGIMNRLICIFGKISKNKFYSRYEVIFSWGGRKIQVKCSMENLSIEVRMNAGGEAIWNELFRIILMAYWRLEYIQHTSTDEESNSTPNNNRKLEELAPSDLQISIEEEDYYITYKELLKDLRNNIKNVKVVKKEEKEDKLKSIPAFHFNPFLDKHFNKPKKVFISYSHDDIDFKIELMKYLVNLERSNKIEIWQDGMIRSGMDWDETIRENLETADIIILLVSQNFIASEYIDKVELKSAFQQKNKGDTNIFPILIKQANLRNWKAISDEVKDNITLDNDDDSKFKVANYQFLPSESGRLKPVNQWEYPGEVWKQISIALEKLL